MNPDSGNSPRSPAEKLIRVGRLTGAHGLKGALRLRPEGGDLETLQALTHVFLEKNDVRGEYRIVSLGPLGRGTLKLVLENVTDCDRADELKGALVMADESELPAPDEDEFYHYQAIGCEVVLLDGRVIGTVDEILSTAANDVFVVHGDGREVLVPVIDDVVKAMDFDARRITIDPVPGLLD